MLLHTSNCTTDHTPYVEVNSSSVAVISTLLQFEAIKLCRDNVWAHTIIVSVQQNLSVSSLL